MMVLLSSSAYKVLLDYVHTHSTSHDCETQSAIHENGDGVYYRFGGAALCEMLHLRYKTIRTCHQSRRDTISKELDFYTSSTLRINHIIKSYL